MTAFTETKVQIDFSAKTAQVGFSMPNTGAFGQPHITVFNVPWDVPGEQTESQIKAAAIGNAKALLRQIV